MKKFGKILLLFLLCSCEQPRPIEEYFDKGYVVVDKAGWDYNNSTYITVKNTEEIKSISVLKFDAVRFNVGDTLKNKTDEKQK